MDVKNLAPITGLVILLGGAVTLEDRVSVLENDMVACCSTEFQSMAAEGMVAAVGRMRKHIEELQFRIETLELFIEGKGEQK
jgi:hypothetical protein